MRIMQITGSLSSIALGMWLILWGLTQMSLVAVPGVVMAVLAISSGSLALLALTSSWLSLPTLAPAAANKTT